MRPARLIGESTWYRRGARFAQRGAIFHAFRCHTCRMDFGTVIWIVVLVVAPVAAILFAGAFGLLDQLGRGGLSVDERPPRPAPLPNSPLRGPNGRTTSASSCRLAATAGVARGEAELDVGRRGGSPDGARPRRCRRRPTSRTRPCGLEVRQLVIARNERRAARGQPPLDVEAEVDRQLRDLA